MNESKEVICDYEEQAKCREYAEIAYQQGKLGGYNQALDEMLELSQEWKDNHGSFLDFQRVLRSKLNQ